MTPLRAAVRGAIAGALGTAAMDALWYCRYRRGGGKSSFADWETSAGLEGWEDAPAPAKFGRLVVQRTLHRDLPPQCARLVNNAVHWSTGVGWGAVFGMVEGTIVRGRAWHGVPFGAAVWLQSYAVLAPLKLYKPIWEYDAATLGRDLSAHLVYGTTTAATINWLFRSRDSRTAKPPLLGRLGSMLDGEPWRHLSCGRAGSTSSSNKRSTRMSVLTPSTPFAVSTGRVT
jgi:hypothetical protein